MLVTSHPLEIEIGDQSDKKKVKYRVFEFLCKLQNSKILLRKELSFFSFHNITAEPDHPQCRPL